MTTSLRAVRSAPILRRLLLLACVLVVVSTGAAQAGTQSISAGLYTCYTNTFTYSGAIALYANGKYAYAYNTSGGNAPRALVRPGWGRVSVRGTRITLSGGPWASFYGVIKTDRKFTVYLKGERYPYTFCNLRRSF